MIYLTAQRVASRRTGTRAINSFRHNREQALSPLGDISRTLDEVAQTPGELVDSIINLPPGGNLVEAYLDLVARDNLTGSDLQRALSAGRTRVASSNEVAWSSDAGTFGRFYGDPHLDLADVFDQLAQQLLLLASGSHGPGPLVIVVGRAPDASVYFLDEPSKLRLALIHGPGWHAPRVRVADDIHRDFSVMHGDLKEHLVDVVVGLDRTYVASLGGVQFVDDGGTVIWRWPPRVSQ